MMTSRRQFVSLLGGAAAAWPLAARAQQSALPVIGFLDATSPEARMDRLRAFRLSLKEAGFVESENVAIEYRWAEDQVDRLPALAADLVRRRVAVIVAPTLAAFAARASTTTIPIVFMVSEDPVRLGLVASLARPGGNATGVNFFNSELTAKRLEVLRELAPSATRFAVLVNPENVATTETTLKDVEPAASALGLQILVLKASTSGEINSAFTSLARERPDALFVAGSSLFFRRRVQLTHLATLHKLPAAYVAREFVEAGGLMSYASDVRDAYRQAATYAGRILKGARPADLPVVQPSKFELVINAETARMLRLTVSPRLLARADEVIE
jgi:putative ABC transport system substrate-binding protein